MNSFAYQSVERTIVRHLLIVNPVTPVTDAVALMNQAQGELLPPVETSRVEASCVLVVSDSRLVGIFTEADLVKLVAGRKSFKGISIAEVMSGELITLKIGEFNNLSTALNLMQQNQIRHLPVIDDGGAVLGIVTQTSLLEALSNIEDAIATPKNQQNTMGELEGIEIITHQQAEATLKENDEKFRLFTDNLKATGIVDIKGDRHQCVHLSPAFQEIWRLSPEEISASDDWASESIHPSARQRYIVNIPGTRTYISPHKQAEVEICKALEKEKELNELKSRFISMASHEFRTPLAIIASSAGILKNFSHKLDEQQKQKHLQCIQTYIQHTTQLLDDILLINKAEAGQLAFNPVLLDLIDFCDSLVEEIQLSAPNHNLIFSAQYLHNSLAQGGGYVAYMDKKLLRQIISNLLSNSIKYSQEGTHVQFNLLIKTNTAIFLVQDEGIGISPEEQRHIFKSFFRASNIGNVSGTGLGLSIVQKCVELHRGQIMVSSEIGAGTTFRVELPLFVK